MASGRALQWHGRIRNDREFQPAVERKIQGRAGLRTGVGRGRRRNPSTRDRDRRRDRPRQGSRCACRDEFRDFFRTHQVRTDRPDQLARAARVPIAGRKAGRDLSRITSSRPNSSSACSNIWRRAGTAWLVSLDFSAGGYRFLPSVFQYSGGVAALPGHAIRRVRFKAPVPLSAGFRADRAAHHRGRPSA